MPYEPVSILEVITDDVGTPTNDGSPGSALYAVPFRLSRRLNHDEAQFLVGLWDSPPRFTTMHRPGTASVSGDRLTLERTTIDEVERYHAETLRHVLVEFNQRAMTVHERIEREEAARHQSIADQETHVSTVTENIDFS